MSQRGGGGGYGRGRGRGGGRGHGRGYHGGGGGFKSEYASDEGGGGRGGRGRGGPRRGGAPAHLKGKEIGLWHAMRQKDKTRENLPLVEISPAARIQISEFVKQLDDLSAKSAGVKCEEDSDFLKKYKQNLFENALASVKREDGSSSSSSVVGDEFSLGRIPSLDDSLLQDLERKQQSHNYQRMLEFRQNLPAYKHGDEFLKLISENQVIVLFGETGCGKTTQISQLILDQIIKAGDGSLCKIVCTQPRRISAISVAERVAAERDEKVGGKSVGYSIRLESRFPTNDRGTILFCTTGVVFQYMKEDPQLRRFSHIIMDEIHERDILSDFMLAVLKDLIVIRPELKVILMSATINAEKFSRYFGDCAMFHIPGFTFPVTEYYLEDVLHKTGFVFESRARNPAEYGYGGRGGHSYNKRRDWRDKNDDSEYESMLKPHLRKLQSDNRYPPSVIRELSKPEAEELNLDLIDSLLQHICTTDKKKGAVLIFVPGWDQISKLHAQLQANDRYPVNEFVIIPLHSLMPTVNQKEVFNRPSGGRRKIVIATNIAETSITIDDIVYVIDSGRIKLTNFDIHRNVESLDTEWVSLSNAKQRRGRAGRVQEGICYHLFNQARHMTLEQFKKPEILRKRLEEVILQIKVLKLGGALKFFRKLLDSPSADSVELAIKRLILINALDSDENLTPLGFHLAQLPMGPETGKMILMAAIFGCVDPITTVAASLSFKDGFYIPLGQEKNVDRVRKELSNDTKSDHMVTVNALEGYLDACERGRERDYCYRHYLSENTLRMLVNMKGQFSQHLYDMKFLSDKDYSHRDNNINSKNLALVKAIICAGLYPNIAKVHSKRKRDGTWTYPKLRTVEDGKVDLHPKSVNCGMQGRGIESPFLAYFQKMRSKGTLLYDTTMVSPLPLIFFGGDPRFYVEKTTGIVSVDQNVEMRIDRDTFQLFQSLRKHLNKHLEEKVNDPKPTCWSVVSKEGAMLRAITGLITAEYREMFGGEDSDSDSSD